MIGQTLGLKRLEANQTGLCMFRVHRSSTHLDPRNPSAGFFCSPRWNRLVEPVTVPRRTRGFVTHFVVALQHLLPVWPGLVARSVAAADIPGVTGAKRLGLLLHAIPAMVL